MDVAAIWLEVISTNGNWQKNKRGTMLLLVASKVDEQPQIDFYAQLTFGSLMLERLLWCHKNHCRCYSATQPVVLWRAYYYLRPVS
jgi:hypothetical protein